MTKIKVLFIILISWFAVGVVNSVGHANIIPPPNPIKLPENRINIHSKKSGVRDFMRVLFSRSNLKYKLASDITNEKKVSVEIKDAKWVEVFDFILTQGNLKYRARADGTIVISRK